METMLKPGETILNGKYRIVELIGEGGMARVWLAEEVAFNQRLVAIKEQLIPEFGLNLPGKFPLCTGCHAPSITCFRRLIIYPHVFTMILNQLCSMP